jgi:two-component system cell cycle sensor histidine kinase/response regulator CckA
MLGFFKKSLLAKLACCFFLLSSFILVTLGLFSYLLFSRDIQNAVFEELAAIAAVQEHMLNQWIQEQTLRVQGIAAIPALRDAALVLLASRRQSIGYIQAYDVLHENLNAYIDHSTDFTEISILEATEGKVLLSTDNSSEGGYRRLDTRYVERERRTAVGTTYGSSNSVKPAMTLTRPFHRSDGTIVGVLAVDLDLLRLDSILYVPPNPKRSIETYLVDRHHTLVARGGLGGEELSQRVHSVGIDSAVTGVDGEGVWVNHRGVSVIGVYRWIESLDMALLAEMQRGGSVVLAPGRGAVLLVSGLFLLVLLAAGSLLIAKRMVNPVVEMKDAALRASGGDLDAKIPVVLKNELGMLAQAFNQMTSRLTDLNGEIQKNKGRFTSLIESSSELMCIADTQGFFTFVSPSVEKLLGYSVHELMGRNMFGFIHPDDVELMKAAVHTAGADESGGSRHETIRVMDRRGKWRSLQTTAKNLSDDSAGGGIIINAHDVTEKIEAAEALRDSEERYRSFFEEDLTGDYIATTDGAILSCNPAFARILGVPTVEEVKRHNLYSFYPDSTDFERFLNLIREKRRLSCHEKEMRNLQGGLVVVVENAIGTFDQRGELVEIKGYIFDNTERQQLEEKLYQVQKMEAVGRLAGGIAHDFNNLLTAIIGYSDMLLMNSPLDRDSYENAHEIRKAAERAATLTQQLLAYSRRQLLQPKVIDINYLVSNMELMLRRLIGEDIQLDTRMDPELMPVKADPGQIEQVIMNLVVNSRDAMPQGGSISIETRNVSLDHRYCIEYPEITPGSYVLLSVRDTGCGMDEETIGRIFDPFFTTKEVGKGTGLGLSMVFGIVKQSGGHITVQSEPNRGTTFNVYLPVMEESETAQGTLVSERSFRKGCESILVVEDEDVVRRMICRVLGNCGYRVYEADGPASALRITEKMQQGDIELVVTDIIMPQMNGRTLSVHLLKRFTSLKILFISGYTEEAIIQQGILEKNTPYLQKPFTMETLMRKVREMLDGSG